jgi:predicted TIM-barrel enzyme
VIVTGPGTGKQTALEDLRIAKQAAGLTPVFAGSGVHARNLAAVLEIADGAIVGTAFKRDGITTNPVERERVTALTKLISQRRLPDSSPTHPRAS